MEKDKRIYIQSAKQISIQKPLSEEWMTNPLTDREGMVQAIEANYRDYFPPIMTRRMEPIMKRALVTALETIKETGIEHPDAIITGTSIGSLDCTEKFFGAMTENNERLLTPTYFMQSTHNTAGSMLGIYTKTHGYNTTYSHGAMSFELALQDAVIQMRLGKIANALVGGYDEMMPFYYSLLCKAEYVGKKGMFPCGEVALSMMVGTDGGAENLCELSGITIYHSLSGASFDRRITTFLDSAGLSLGDVDAVFTGVNGDPANDRCYECPLLTGTPLVAYKQLFGENFTVSALGVYAAAECLNKGYIPLFMYYRNQRRKKTYPRNILLLNQQKGKDFSLILLKRL